MMQSRCHERAKVPLGSQAASAFAKRLNLPVTSVRASALVPEQQIRASSASISTRSGIFPKEDFVRGLVSLLWVCCGATLTDLCCARGNRDL